MGREMQFREQFGTMSIQQNNNSMFIFEVFELPNQGIYKARFTVLSMHFLLCHKPQSQSVQLPPNFSATVVRMGNSRHSINYHSSQCSQLGKSTNSLPSISGTVKADQQKGGSLVSTNLISTWTTVKAHVSYMIGCSHQVLVVNQEKWCVLFCGGISRAPLTNTSTDQTLGPNELHPREKRLV